MRKTFYLASAVLLFGLASCSKEFARNEEITSLSFTVDDLVPVEDIDSPNTKTSLDDNKKIIWADGDTVGIYPNAGAQVFFSTEIGSDASSVKFDGGGWDFKAGSLYYGYYPFIGDIYLDRNRIPVSFTGQKQVGATGISHIGAHHYMYTDATSSNSGSLSFAFHHLCCIINPKLTLPAGTYTKLAITAPSAVFAKKGYYNLAAGNCAIVPTETSNQIQIDLQGITLTQESLVAVYLTSAPVDLKGQQITVSVLNSEGVEKQCIKTPSAVYAAGALAGLTCSSWTDVPQSVGFIISNWGDGGSISGGAE